MITHAEQIAEAQRELARRRKCSPQWVKSRKRAAGDAQYHIMVQEAMVRTWMRLDAEQRQMHLFDAQLSPPWASSCAPVQKGEHHAFPLWLVVPRVPGLENP
jgi:hypothetical protein